MNFLAVCQEALRTRGLKDDTTCIVVDIIPPENPLPPVPPPKKQNKLKALFFWKKARESSSKLSKKLSAMSIVEELFEEGSAMLAERSVISFILWIIRIQIMHTNTIISIAFCIRKL